MDNTTENASRWINLVAKGKIITTIRLTNPFPSKKYVNFIQAGPSVIVYGDKEYEIESLLDSAEGAFNIVVVSELDPEIEKVLSSGFLNYDIEYEAISAKTFEDQGGILPVGETDDVYRMTKITVSEIAEE